MILTFYSFLMAMIASSLMIVLIFVMKKTRYFSLVFNVPFIILLYVMSLVRIFVPLEIPKVQTVFEDEYVLGPIMNVLENRSELTQDMPLMFVDILGIVAVSVSAVLILVFVIRQMMYTKRLKKLTNHVTQREPDLFNDTLESVFKKKKKVTLIKTDFVSMPMVTGLFSNIVLIPNEEYDEQEEKFVFLHECTHLKNRDLLFKLLIHIYCCVFWWNPFVYLLKSDIDFLLELKCDNKACRDMDELTKLDYIKSINDNAIRQSLKKARKPQLVSSGFAFSNGTKRHVTRMNNLLYPKQSTKKNVFFSILLSVMILAIWVLSFLFIWQPAYTIRNTEMLQQELEKPGAGVMSDETNSYLVEQEDGSYIFYFDGEEIPVPKEEFDAGGYETYPIYDEPK